MEKSPSIKMAWIDDDLFKYKEFLFFKFKDLSDSENLNIEIDFFESPVEFLKSETDNYLVVVSDYVMPEINGLELFKNLYKNKNKKTFILVTGGKLGEHIYRQAESGVIDLIFRVESLDLLVLNIIDKIKTKYGF